MAHADNIHRGSLAWSPWLHVQQPSPDHLIVCRSPTNMYCSRLQQYTSSACTLTSFSRVTHQFQAHNNYNQSFKATYFYLLQPRTLPQPWQSSFGWIEVDRSTRAFLKLFLPDDAYSTASEEQHIQGREGMVHVKHTHKYIRMDEPSHQGGPSWGQKARVGQLMIRSVI